MPENFSVLNYSARYHTDILTPRSLPETPSAVGDPAIEDWKSWTIEYFTARQYQLGSIDFGMFHGYPVDDEAVYFNPFSIHFPRYAPSTRHIWSIETRL